jgi:hypothetical protein
MPLNWRVLQRGHLSNQVINDTNKRADPYTFLIPSSNERI